MHAHQDFNYNKTSYGKKKKKKNITMGKIEDPQTAKGSSVSILQNDTSYR